MKIPGGADDMTSRSWCARCARTREREGRGVEEEKGKDGELVKKGKWRK